MFEYAWPTESDTMRKCDLVGIGMVLLDEVSPCGDELPVSCAQALHNVEGALSPSCLWMRVSFC